MRFVTGFIATCGITDLIAWFLALATLIGAATADESSTKTNKKRK